ncbi:MAG: 30S ribosome-binding factor RbfA [Capsulimonas sp.]|jgi:ribosome-binding factor A|uniref:30S ribosome-binding factor RbfA n=1 Tax=Capsulimonas sp. TaxID=2494211 RepID=UPI0032654ECA|nr:ribosome-binding factor [Capsulimonas sp.]
MPATRKQRLQETLRAEISDIIRRDLRDPRFSKGLLSITEVEVTPDLKHATVFFSVLGDEQARKDELAALKGATGHLRGELGRRKTVINVPEISFRYDDALERGGKMFEMLERIKREDAERAAAAPAEDEDAEETDEPGDDEDASETEDKDKAGA